MVLELIIDWLPINYLTKHAAIKYMYCADIILKMLTVDRFR